MFRARNGFLALALLVSGSGCSSCNVEVHGPGLTVERAEVVKGITTELTGLELAPQEVRCPGSGEKIHTSSKSFICTAVVDGVEIPYTMTIDILAGRVHGKFDRTPVRVSRLERILAEKQKQPEGQPTITCPGPAIRFSDPAEDFECELVLGGQHARLLVHWKDKEGNLDMKPAG